MCQGLAVLSEPVVRLVDRLVRGQSRSARHGVGLLTTVCGVVGGQTGSTNAMRVEGTGFNGQRVQALYAHKDLEECVGQAVVSFAAQVLNG